MLYQWASMGVGSIKQDLVSPEPMLALEASRDRRDHLCFKADEVKCYQDHAAAIAIFKCCRLRKELGGMSL